MKFPFATVLRKYLDFDHTFEGLNSHLLITVPCNLVTRHKYRVYFLLVSI